MCQIGNLLEERAMEIIKKVFEFVNLEFLWNANVCSPSVSTFPPRELNLLKYCFDIKSLAKSRHQWVVEEDKLNARKTRRMQSPILCSNLNTHMEISEECGCLSSLDLQLGVRLRYPSCEPWFCPGRWSNPIRCDFTCAINPKWRLCVAKKGSLSDKRRKLLRERR